MAFGYSHYSLSSCHNIPFFLQKVGCTEWQEFIRLEVHFNNEETNELYTVVFYTLMQIELIFYFSNVRDFSLQMNSSRIIVLITIAAMIMLLLIPVESIPTRQKRWTFNTWRLHGRRYTPHATKQSEPGRNLLKKHFR